MVKGYREYQGYFTTTTTTVILSISITWEIGCRQKTFRNLENCRSRRNICGSGWFRMLVHHNMGSSIHEGSFVRILWHGTYMVQRGERDGNTWRTYERIIKSWENPYIQPSRSFSLNIDILSRIKAFLSLPPISIAMQSMLYLSFPTRSHC